MQFFKKIIKKIFESFNYEILKTKYDNKQLSYEYLNLERIERIQKK